jgi:CRP/FNR family transcriptional regulator, cyclic AMP receptor protein
MVASRPGAYPVQFSGDAQSFVAGATIFAEGEAGDTMYVVKEGHVDVLIHGEVIETVGPRGMLGEMALIDHNPRSATAIAKTDCQLVPINEARFSYLVQQTPFFAIEVMRVMARRLRHMDAQG